MSKNNRKLVNGFIASMLFALGGAIVFASPAAQAQDQTLSAAVAKVLGEAFTLIQEKADPTPADYQQAISMIENLVASRRDRMSPYELATAYELIGSYKSQLDPPDYRGALRAFETAVNQNALPDTRQRQLRYFIAQLYFQEERYPEAIRFLEEYISFQEAGGAPINANTWYLLAAAYVATENYRGARRPMENALRLHKREAGKQNKSYYDLMNAIYSNVEANSERGDLLVDMINLWPEESSYWAQLSGAYSIAGRDADAAAVLELAYKSGIITDADKIIALVQYYSVLENPYRGAKLLEREMAAGNIPRTQKNLELLAQMWNLSREQKKAAEALKAAAQMSPNGELFYRLGQVYFADEQWNEAETNLQQAINRGGISSRVRANAWLLIGNARYNKDTNSPAQRSSAKAAWRQCLNTSGVSSADRAAAQGWIRYVIEVERTECNQDKVERTVKIDNFKKDFASCESTLNIIDRAGGDFQISISEERIAECRKLVTGTIDETTALVSYADGTTDEYPAPAAYCRQFN